MEDNCEEYRRPDLIKWVNSTSIIVEANTEKLDEMKIWCDTHVGEMRPHHPLQEAEQGWMDFFDGEWCYTKVDSYDYPTLSTQKFNFWFWKQSDKTRFTLTFG